MWEGFPTNQATTPESVSKVDRTPLPVRHWPAGYVRTHASESPAQKAHRSGDRWVSERVSLCVCVCVHLLYDGRKKL